MVRGRASELEGEKRRKRMAAGRREW